MCIYISLSLYIYIYTYTHMKSLLKIPESCWNAVRWILMHTPTRVWMLCGVGVAGCLIFPHLGTQHRTRLVRNITTKLEGENDDDADKGTPTAAKKNKLGYQKEGEEYVNEHDAGSNDEEDGEIRANVDGRILRSKCGIGVVGQSADDQGKKQICGVLSLPVAVEPDVYVQEALR